MTTIFTGSGTGLERGSGNILGLAGQIGNSSMGRGDEGVSVNAANGNLVITHQDEFLTGRGPDIGVARTYNSQGNLSDDNGDNWRYSAQRRIMGLTGTANSAGSTVKRIGADGAEIVVRL